MQHLSVFVPDDRITEAWSAVKDALDPASVSFDPHDPEPFRTDPRGSLNGVRGRLVGIHTVHIKPGFEYPLMSNLTECGCTVVIDSAVPEWIPDAVDGD